MTELLKSVPSLAELATAAGATEHKDGSFLFARARDAAAVAAALGAEVALPDESKSDVHRRAAKLVEHKGGRLVMDVERIPYEGWSKMPGWIEARASGLPHTWQRTFTAREEVCDFIRHLVTTRGRDAGWVVFTDGQWRSEKITTIKDILVSRKLKRSRACEITGACAAQPWTLVRVPFAPEYPKPGERVWNRDAPRLKSTSPSAPGPLPCPTWTRILGHIGRGLDAGVRADAWCRAHGVATGADYLRIWIASLIRFPAEPLPYLFLYSRRQNTGKSILGEALERLIIDGVVRAKAALKSRDGFNAELDGRVLCIVEEGDLKGVEGVYERIKEWVNSPTIQIHPKGATPYQATNFTHWLHTSNSPDGCPIDAGDTRVTMAEVPPLDPSEVIPKPELLALLDAEAAGFLASLMHLDIPPSNDRLRVPAVETAAKASAIARGRSELHAYLDEEGHAVEGATLLIKDFWPRFEKWLKTPARRAEWSRKRVGQEMPEEFPRGRRRKDGQWCYGNLSLTPPKPGAPALPRLALRGEMLVPETELFVPQT